MSEFPRGEKDKRGYPGPRPDRPKTDHSQSSHGPLSSLKAVIKRTKPNSQSKHNRGNYKRRPEITILSAEPLDCSKGSPLVLSAPAPQRLQSFHQVQESQEEHVVRPVAPPRRLNCTTQHAAAPTKTTGKRPPKPPRPCAPKNKKTPSAEPISVNLESTPSCDHQDTESSLASCPQTNGCIRSVTVYWNNTASTETTTTNTTTTTTATTTQPVPLPRIKSKKPLIRPDESHTLVQFSENPDCSDCPADSVSSNKYLEELLEVFNAENVDLFNQFSAEIENADEMSGTSSFRARIQAFENQADGTPEPVKPQPKARTKPLVAAKPSVTTKPRLSADDLYEEVCYSPPTPAPKPAKTPVEVANNSVKQELDAILAQHRSKPPTLSRDDSIHDEEEFVKVPPTPPVKPVKEPLKPNLNINNHNNVLYEDPESNANHFPFKPEPTKTNYAGSRQSLTKRPTTIIVPSKSASFSDGFQDSAPPLPVQNPVGTLNAPQRSNRHSIASFPPRVSPSASPEPTLPPRRLTTKKTLPPRPVSMGSGPGRPPPPRMEASSRSNSMPWDTPPKPQPPKPQKKGPVLPPRPNPGHRLYNKYTLQVPHAIASSNYNSGSTGELSFQKNDVLLLVDAIDLDTFECQVGDKRGRVHRSSMKVITPLSTASPAIPIQSVLDTESDYGLTVEALHNFSPENPIELGLKAGDIVTMVEQVDSEWYKGTCRGNSGFFPINYVKVLPNSPRLPDRTSQKPPATVSGPRCVARFDFQGEHSDELSFSEGDVIQLKAYVGQDWARGELGTFSGIFPLNFVEIIQDLPPASSQQQTQPSKIALPGMTKSTLTQAALPAQSPPSGAEWAVALYDFSGNRNGDLSFEKGDRILITKHINQEWSSGKVNGREGIFPRAFVESKTTGQASATQHQNGSTGGVRAKALYDFTSDCEEELSIRVGDIITNVESADDEWFLGDLRGIRALVPKNYVQVM